MERATMNPLACNDVAASHGTDGPKRGPERDVQGPEPTPVRNQELEAAREVLCEKWKPTIVRLLMHRHGGPLRYSELQRLLPGPTHKVLTEQLVDLVRDGIVCRTEYTHASRHVEYSLTTLGAALQPVISALETWALQYGAHRDRRAVRERDGRYAPGSQRPAPITQVVPARVRSLESVDGESRRVLHIGPERD